ncbi:hypothetical protein RUM43_014809 [Polyplax serrata]|uniref:Uncharacterized protein n=1 Tax=Polyplax serrata TaxID=468196 RepID=A0AAN8S6Q7_POLSC
MALGYIPGRWLGLNGSLDQLDIQRNPPKTISRKNLSPWKTCTSAAAAAAQNANFGQKLNGIFCVLNQTHTVKKCTIQNEDEDELITTKTKTLRNWRLRKAAPGLKGR